jgi:anti-sigma factor RsiW
VATTPHQGKEVPRYESHPAPLRRRQVLRAAAGVGLTGLVGAGCATRKPAEVVPPPKPVSLVAVLPAVMMASDAATGFGARPVYVVGGGRGINPAAAIGVGLIGMAIAKDKRWVTTPKSMTFASLDKLKAEAPAARAGLEAMTGQFVSMVDDVDTALRGIRAAHTSFKGAASP